GGSGGRGWRQRSKNETSAKSPPNQGRSTARAYQQHDDQNPGQQPPPGLFFVVHLVEVVVYDVGIIGSVGHRRTPHARNECLTIIKSRLTLCKYGGKPRMWVFLPG